MMHSFFGFFAGLALLVFAVYAGEAVLTWSDKLPDPQPVNYTTVEKYDRLSLPCPEVK